MCQKGQIFSLLTVLLVFFADFLGFSGRANADIFYAVSNYKNGSAGVITKNGNYSVYKNLISNVAGDAEGFTFTIRPPSEARLSTGATGAAAIGPDKKYLYLATYESYSGSSSGQDTGEVIWIDMSGGYLPDKRYQYAAFTSEAGNFASPHGEAIEILGGKIYVLFSVSYNGVSQYEPCEIVEFDEIIRSILGTFVVMVYRIADVAQPGTHSCVKRHFERRGRHIPVHADRHVIPHYHSIRSGWAHM
jgi:hypothetical protein